MKHLAQFAKAFLDGFLPMFGLIVIIGGSWYWYQQNADELSKMPVIQEITDAYKVGWEETMRLGDQVAGRIVRVSEQTGIPSLAKENEHWDIQVSWSWQAIEAKFENRGWSKGKMKAAHAYLAYIDEYMDEAMEDMHATKVSASITIAQGILESNAGRSGLATKTNNHFGIKARPSKVGRQKIKEKNFAQLSDYDFIFRHPAVGVSQHYDDHRYDRFEVYTSVLDSYKRHSDLLQNSCKVARKGCYAWIWENYPVQKERVDITEMAQVFERVSGYAPNDFFGQTNVPYYAAQAAGLKMAGYATSKTYHEKLVYLIETYELWRLDIALIQATA